MSEPEQPLSDGVQPSTTPSGDSPNSNYAFLVHSQKTLTQNLPPRVDNKALARQKRRRTSPGDQKILEAEYQRNPKPDRATRAEIVNRVTLGEKEVQIWFQNRRQNDRRRSKPLNLEDLKPSKSSGSDDAPNDDDIANSGSQPTQLSKSGQEADSQVSNDAPREYISPQTSFGSGTGDDCGGTTASSQPSDSQQEAPRGQTTNSERHVSVNQGGQITSTNEQSYIQPINRKRSRSEPEITNAGSKHIPPAASTFIPPSLRISLSFDGEAVIRKEGEKTPSPQKPRDSIRISMSADGEALIRAANEESPTKNRTSLLNSTRPAFGGLRRSISAIPLSTLRGTPDQKDPKPFGRSRDPRNWELYCDTDARTALSGSKNNILSSTARAGKLGRRKSDLGHRRALMPRTNLPNALPLSEEPSGKRKKLSRTMSSMPRLESGNKLSTSKAGGAEIDLYSGDSDKENWIPGTQTSARRAPNKQRARRGILQNPSRRGDEQNWGRSIKGSNKMNRGYRGLNPNSTQGGGDAGSQKPSGETDEISRLMSGPSQDEDLDCIQGLLSLSQGAWR
ncbi:hypothetical protein AJ79_07598 [Helicocarpus griseus UAMH5409]|uniref:Homeobox domain-containing protein n=1 Tax=Helicocarpus griseus UAMH5409 TaxID=1447875 RepID=A0A2B7WT95_9EURO|nr:hypothetical protein AJ79_07598 [Helicocarpus griseus UAMH5409]